MLNSKYTTMYGMRTYGHNLGGTATDMYAKQEALEESLSKDMLANLFVNILSNLIE